MAEEKQKQEEAKQEEVSKQKQEASEEKAEAKAEESSEAASDEVEVPEKFKDLVEKIENLSVLELSELVEILEKKFGVSAVPMAGAAAPAAGGGEEAPAAEEKDSYDIELKDAGEQKIGVVKVVKEITQKGLKDAKDLVDGAPAVIMEGVKKEDVEEIKGKLEEAGATVELK